MHSFLKTSLLAGVTSIALAGASLAQPLGTDLLGTAGSNLVRITPTGVITTIATGPGSLNMLAMANDNHDILVATRTPASVYRVDPSTNSIIGTVVSAGFMREVDYFNPLHTGEFLCASDTGLFAFDEAGNTRTIVSGAPFSSLQGSIQDLTDGTIAAGDVGSVNRGVFSVGLDGTVVTLYVPNTMSPFSLTQDHRDGQLIVGAGAGGTVYRVDQASNSFTTVTTMGRNANSIAFDRWSGNGEIVVGNTTINRVDITGTIIQSHPGVTRTGACFDKERNLVSRRVAANRYAVDIHVPGQAGNPFILGVSLTGFVPGIPVDSRVIQLAPDNAFFLSIQGLLAPFVQGNVGTLSPNDRAQATIDLSRLGSIPGLRAWAVAATVDSTAPSNVGVITKPIIIVFE